MGNKISKLILKFVTGFLVLGILICAVSSGVGYSQYKSLIQKQYNDMAYQCAEVAISYMEQETLESYVELVKGYRDGTVPEEALRVHIESEEYTGTVAKLATLRQAMNANDIFFVYVDREELLSYDGDSEGWIPLSYLFDCYTVEEYSYVLGDTGSINPEYIDEATEILNTGVKSDSYFISEGDYGYNTSALVPVMDAKGTVIALVGVEVPMSTITEALRQYITYAILITVMLVSIFIVVYMVYWYRTVIMPIDKIAAAAAGFIENESRISESLSQIKTKDEIQNLAESILKMQTDINDYINNITHITAEKERISAEMNVATNIQLSMLPSVFPAFPERPEFDIYAKLEVASEMDGDFYDFFLVDQTHLAVVIGEIMGQGVPAALLMMITRTLIKNYSQLGYSPARVFAEANNQLSENNEGMTATAFLGVIDLVSGEFTYVNAAHNIPLLKHAGGEFDWLPTEDCFTLGIMEGVPYWQQSVHLVQGDLLFLYTNGLVKAENPAHTQYGLEQMQMRLNHVLGEVYDLEQIAKAMEQDVEDFREGVPRQKDITMLLFRYFGI